MFIVFAFCEGYHYGQLDFFAKKKEFEGFIFSKKDFEEIKNFERVRGYEHGFKDGLKSASKGITIEDND